LSILLRKDRDHKREEGRGKMEANNPAGGGMDFPSLKRNDVLIPAFRAQTDSVSAS
jgi:hypothetical protein